MADILLQLSLAIQLQNANDLREDLTILIPGIFLMLSEVY